MLVPALYAVMPLRYPLDIMDHQTQERRGVGIDWARAPLRRTFDHPLPLAGYIAHSDERTAVKVVPRPGHECASGARSRVSAMAEHTCGHHGYMQQLRP